MSEQMWMERAQSAEARLSTMEQAHKAAIGRVRDFKANFGVRERDNGEIVIDYHKLVKNLGIEGSLELRSVIDEVHNISGKAGEKPRIKVVSG